MERPDQTDFPVLAPPYTLWSPRWRTRVDELETLFAAGDQLLWRFAEARAAGLGGSDLDAQRLVGQIVEESRNLFPRGQKEPCSHTDDAGFQLAWSITCAAPPPRYRPQPLTWRAEDGSRKRTVSYQPRELFHDRIPPLRPGRRKGKNDVVASQLLAALEGNPGRDPLTLIQAVEELGTLTTTRADAVQLHKMLDRLRQRGVAVPHADEQTRYANAVKELRSGVRKVALVDEGEPDPPIGRQVLAFFI